MSSLSIILLVLLLQLNKNSNSLAAAADNSEDRLTLSTLSPIVASDVDCKSAHASLASLGLWSIAGASSTSGPICGGRCCDSRVEALLASLARRQLADLLRNYLTTSGQCSIDSSASPLMHRLHRVKIDLPATMASIATLDCLVQRIRLVFCSICRGEQAAFEVASWSVENLGQCLTPLRPLSKTWDQLIDIEISRNIATGTSACLKSMRGLLNFEGLLNKCKRMPCTSPPSPSSDSYLTSVKPLSVLRLINILQGTAADDRQRLRRFAQRVDGSGGAAPPSPLSNSPASGDRQPPIGARVGVGNATSRSESKIGGATSGDDAQPPPPPHRPPLVPTLLPPSQNHNQQQQRPTVATPDVDKPDTGASGDTEPPVLPSQTPIVDIFPPIPDPRQPPPSDLWLPKTYPDGEGEAGGAVGNRGEGSIHGPQMVAMRGQRRECLYADSARCAGSAAARFGPSLLSVATCATVALVASIFAVESCQ